MASEPDQEHLAEREIYIGYDGSILEEGSNWLLALMISNPDLKDLEDIMVPRGTSSNGSGRTVGGIMMNVVEFKKAGNGTEVYANIRNDTRSILGFHPNQMASPVRGFLAFSVRTIQRQFRLRRSCNSPDGLKESTSEKNFIYATRCETLFI